MFCLVPRIQLLYINTYVYVYPTQRQTNAYTKIRTCLGDFETLHSSCIRMIQANVNETDKKKSTPIMHAVSLHDQKPMA